MTKKIHRGKLVRQSEKYNELENYLCARTCDYGSSLTLVLRVLNTQHYTGQCGATKLKA